MTPARRASVPRFRSGRPTGRLAAAALAAVLCTIARPARAQMFGAPVLQNVFANPHTTLGLDAGSGDGGHGYGVALAWGDARERLQLSGGLAAFVPTSSGSARATWGVRLMVPVFRRHAPAVRVAAFAGLGGLSIGGAALTRIPLGAAVGWRRALGAHGALSLYAAPFFEWSRLKQDSLALGHGGFRVSVGMDIALSARVGLTAGLETGARAPAGQPGPTGELFGIGLSYALRPGS